MLKSTVIDYSTKEKYSFSFFDDDTINVVRQQIAKTLDTHQDRLFILVALKLPNDYYVKDPRRWEKLFERLSYNGQPLTKTPFDEYQKTYKIPQTSTPFQPYSKVDWLNNPEDLQEIYNPNRDFTEYRILGVEEEKSYIMPLDFHDPYVSKIPAARLPIPLDNSLISTLYDISSVVEFIAVRHEEKADNVLPFYFPFMQSKTPTRLSNESIGLLDKNEKLLNGLFNLEDIVKPKSVHVTHVRFFASFVTTDFGSAVRSRFEQIFYGLTLSEDIPYIGYITSKNEVGRHKFYVKTPKSKKPFVDMSLWNRWANRKVYRNRPTLVLYRGTSKDNFDRVSISATDINITVYRDEDNKETIPEMKKKVLAWLKTFDAVMAFITKEDIASDRWETQDIQFYAKYSRVIKNFDLRRFDCISSLFNIADNDKAKFGFLRTDKEFYGISQLDITIIQMMKEGVVNPSDIANSLNISIDEARRAHDSVIMKIEDDPNLMDRVFRGYPIIEMKNDTVKVSNVNEIDRIIKYADILRFVIGYSDAPSLDSICPKRMETVNVDTAIAPVDTFESQDAIDEQYLDLFDYLEGEEDEPVKITEQIVTEPVTSKVKKQKTSYSYYLDRLEKFDPDTFVPKTKDFMYAKKCEHDHQPIILSEEELNKWKNTEYDPQTYLPDNQMIETQDPNGLIICPEYWCMNDQIPLIDEQLEEDNGHLVCPVCGTKLRTSESQNQYDYALIKRKNNFVYPGYKDFKSPVTGKYMPCCFQTPRKEKKTQPDDKYYVIRENIYKLKELRIAFLTKPLVQALQLGETYASFKGPTNRLSTGMSAFFRVGLGRPAETLPTLLNLKTKIASPKDSIESVLKCSFLRTWKTKGDQDLTEIENSLQKIPPYDKTSFVRSELAKIISGINSAFENKKLSTLEELEYASIFLQCDIFRIFTNKNALGCLFYSPIIKPRTRGIIVLQNDDNIDIVSYVTRVQKGFEYKSNIFELPFKDKTYLVVEEARDKSCKTKVPTLMDAITIMKEITPEKYSVILDPFGRGQALYVPNVMVLPFYPVVLPDIEERKIMGYSEITEQTLPKYTDVVKHLETAKKFIPSYSLSEDLYNTEGKRTEILLTNGLRIPVYPEYIQKYEPLEVIDTVNQIGEDQLVFGEPSQEVIRRYKEISYASEIYEFLLFELTKDLQKNDYSELRNTLREAYPKRNQVEPLLQKWFDENTVYVKSKKPIEFISKVRSPCGQFTSKDTCSGNLCSWNGKTCGVEVRDTIRKDSLFHRLLTTLIDNSKIRAMILDGRTSPFFSTILYIELPNELIVTDLELK